ncbi:MAG TPA: class I SAM-dependent methyltransferase [Candidatus Angelobacter sp.]|nr:class I SAM-dependent methyltransferase [Candidatus Angelobacter sp.]
MSTTVFDPEKFKESTRQQWQNAAKAWNAWGVFLRQWLGPATQHMLDMARVAEDSRVLDVAAGAGDQTMLIAEKVGAKGHVLATDISSNILEFARENAQRAGLKNVETRVLDGEDLKLPDDSFDAVVSRLGSHGLPTPRESRRRVQPCSEEGWEARTNRLLYPRKQSVLFGSLVDRSSSCWASGPASGTAGHIQPRQPRE